MIIAIFHEFVQREHPEGLQPLFSLLYLEKQLSKEGVCLGNRGNMTEGMEWKHLLRFALPLMAGHILQQLYNTVDSIIVGNFVSEQALAAVGTCAPLTMLFVALAIGMSAGSSIVVAQCFGAGRTKDLRRAASTAIIVLVGMGLVLSAVGVLAARPLLAYALNVNPIYLNQAVEYFTIYAMGLVFQFAYNIAAALLRALGDSKATLYFLLVSSVTNVVLDLLFVIVFHWGVAGAAIATVVSQALSAVVAMVYMVRKHEVLRFQKGEFRFYRRSAALALRLAVPTTLQQCVVSCGNLVMQRLINSFDHIYAGLTTGAVAGMRLEGFVIIPILCLNTAVATFAGQNVGAGKPERVQKGRRSAVIMGLMVTAFTGGLALLLREPLVTMFGVGEQALVYGVMYISILAPSLLLFSLHMTTSAVMQGAGDVGFNTFVTLSSFLLRCILAYVLAYNTPLEFRAVWLTIPMGWVYNVILSWSRFYSGKWKEKALVHKEL